MQLLPDGPSPEQIIRDAAGEPDGMDPRTAIVTLQRLKKGQENLKRAVRWPGRTLKRWSETELVAAEYMYQCNIDALDMALDVLSLLAGAPL